jgi:mono/diheme cytochrome c family protein
MSRAGATAAAGGAILVAALGGCDDSRAFHRPDWTLARMQKQRRGDPYGESEAFPDRAVMRAPPAGAVEWGAGEPPWRDGPRYRTVPPFPLSRAALQRGRVLFETYCAPCHGESGDANSVVASKMELRKPRSLQEDPVRAYPAGRIYEVVRLGYGLMPSYASSIADPADRWDVVAYVRALQMSQHADVRRLPADLKIALGERP